MVERLKGTELEWIAPVIQHKSMQSNLVSGERKLVQKDAIPAVLEAIGQSESYEETMSRCLQAIDHHTEFDSAALLKLDETGDFFDLIASVGYSAQALASAKRLPFENSLSGQSVKNSHIVTSLDLENDQRVNPAVKQAMLSQGRTTLVSVPLILRRKPIGVMNIAWNDGRPLEDHEKQLLMTFGYGIALTMEAALQEHRAKYDQLTGLLNRMQFEHQLSLFEGLYGRYEAPLSIMVLDLDHFKMVNDSRGHGVGDEALRKLGKFIMSCLRGTDLAYRIGGEEIVILMPNTAIAGTESLANRLLTGLREMPITDKAKGDEFFLTASIGIAELRSNENAKDTLNRADSAMYKSKNNGRDQYSLT